MGLSWRQGPLSTGAIGRFLVPEPLPKRYCTSSRCVGGCACASAEPRSPKQQVLLLFEPGRYPVAYFPRTDVSSHALERPAAIQRPDLGSRPCMRCERASTSHHEVRGGTLIAAHAANCRTVTFAWQAMNAYYEEDERIVAVLLTATTASIFAKRLATSSSGS